MRKDIHYYTAEELRAIRKQVGLNQTEFWNKFGITQSGGSRYESGRDVPEPVQILLNVALAKPNRSEGLVGTTRNCFTLPLMKRRIRSRVSSPQLPSGIL